MEHIPPIWVFTALHALYLLKKEASATLRKKPHQFTLLLLQYRFLFCNGKEGILKHSSQGFVFIMSLPEIHLFGWKPYLWNELWRVEERMLFFPLFFLFRYSGELQIPWTWKSGTCEINYPSYTSLYHYRSKRKLRHRVCSPVSCNACYWRL